MIDFLQTVGDWPLGVLTAIVLLLMRLDLALPELIFLFFAWLLPVWYLYDQTRRYGFFDATGFGPAAAMFVILHLAWLAGDVPYMTFLIGWIVPLAIGCALALSAGLLMRWYRPDFTNPMVWLDSKTDRAWVMAGGGIWFRDGPDAPWRREFKNEPPPKELRDTYESVSGSEAVKLVEAVRSKMTARSSAAHKLK